MLIANAAAAEFRSEVRGFACEGVTTGPFFAVVVGRDADAVVLPGRHAVSRRGPDWVWSDGISDFHVGPNPVRVFGGGYEPLTCTDITDVMAMAFDQIASQMPDLLVAELTEEAVLAKSRQRILEIEASTSAYVRLVREGARKQIAAVEAQAAAAITATEAQAAEEVAAAEAQAAEAKANYDALVALTPEKVVALEKSAATTQYRIDSLAANYEKVVRQRDEAQGQATDLRNRLCDLSPADPLCPK